MQILLLNSYGIKIECLLEGWNLSSICDCIILFILIHLTLRSLLPVRRRGWCGATFSFFYIKFIILQRSFNISLNIVIFFVFANHQTTISRFRCIHDNHSAYPLQSYLRRGIGHWDLSVEWCQLVWHIRRFILTLLQLRNLLHHLLIIPCPFPFLIYGFKLTRRHFLKRHYSLQILRRSSRLCLVHRRLPSFGWGALFGSCWWFLLDGRVLIYTLIHKAWSNDWNCLTEGIGDLSLILIPLSWTLSISH